MNSCDMSTICKALLYEFNEINIEGGATIIQGRNIMTHLTELEKSFIANPTSDLEKKVKEEHCINVAVTIMSIVNVFLLGSGCIASLFVFILSKSLPRDLDIRVIVGPILISFALPFLLEIAICIIRCRINELDLNKRSSKDVDFAKCLQGLSKEYLRYAKEKKSSHNMVLTGAEISCTYTNKYRFNPMMGGKENQGVNPPFYEDPNDADSDSEA